jgi:hypothetical protein
VDASFDFTTDARYGFSPWIAEFGGLRAASTARAKAFLLGRIGKRKENHLLASRFSGRTRRAAVNSRRADGVYERAVGGTIPHLDRAPKVFARLMGRGVSGPS